MCSGGIGGALRSGDPDRGSAAQGARPVRPGDLDGGSAVQGGVHEGGSMCINPVDPLCCTADTNTTW